MKSFIDFDECLKDSPRFRMVLEDTESDVDLLEIKLDKVVKLCTTMIEAGKVYLSAKSSFVNGMSDLCGYFKDDTAVVNTLNKVVQTFTEILKFHSILIDQAHRSICKNLNSFIKGDIKHVKETKKYFDKISDDLDNALIRNSQTPKTKVHECEEATNVLHAVKACFGHTALDYVFQLNVLQSKKSLEILDTMLSFMHAHSTFFHQGYDLFADIDPFMKQLASTVSQERKLFSERANKTQKHLEKMRSEAAAKEKDMNERHNLVQQKENSLIKPRPPSTNENVNTRMEGYLFKRTSNAFKTWNRRWFMIMNNQLVYRKRVKDTLTIMEEDLRICTVKPLPDIDRRFCFEVVSPSKNHTLQADSEALYHAWINAMQAGIATALHGTRISVSEADEIKLPSIDSLSQDGKSKAPPKPPRASNFHMQISSIPGNNKCCDCESLNPRWASINLGIVLCIECSGIHRSLGVQVSKVRSTTLDSWEPELLKAMAELGNDIVNKIYEANVDESIAIKATPECSRNIRESWIKAKYVQKAFVRKLIVAQPRLSRKLRHWTVRKLNRRRRAAAQRKSVYLSDEEANKLNTTGKFNQDEWDLRKGLDDSKENVETLATEDAQIDENSSIKEAGSDRSDSDVLVFGEMIESSDSLATVSVDSTDESPVDSSSELTESEDLEKLHPSLLLYKAARAYNLSIMLEALALGADSNWLNAEDRGQSPFHQSIASGSLMACEFLLLNGAKVNVKDGLGRTPLHIATELGHTGQVCLLLKRGADQHILDDQGQDALKVAVDNANADIVTLLRLARLNEEMKESDYGNTGDETFNEVVRDFSRMASHDPDKLRRKSSDKKPSDSTTQ